MHITVKPKTYGPLTLESGPDDTLVFTTEAGYQLRGSLTPQPQGLSPSDLLLASLANCLAISMRMAARPMGLSLGRLAVSAQVSKASDLPNRFGRFDVDIRCEGEVPAGQEADLLRRTKEICTVSNTLNADVVVRLNP